jgi:hypothetical protein
MDVATEDVSLYEPPDRKIQLSARVPLTLREGLDDVVRLWRLLAEARGDNAEAIDLTYVLVRLAKAGIDQSFDEFGGRPSTEEGWKLLASAIAKSVKKSSTR